MALQNPSLSHDLDKQRWPLQGRPRDQVIFFFREKRESRLTGKEKGRLIAGYSFMGKMILTAV